MSLTKETFVVYGFASTTQALMAEKHAQKISKDIRLIPRPQELGNAECGMALRVPQEYVAALEKCFSDVSLAFEARTRIEDYV